MSVNDKTEFDGMDSILDDSDIGPDDVETPTEEELEELTPVELNDKYGTIADFYVGEE